MWWQLLQLRIFILAFLVFQCIVFAGSFPEYTISTDDGNNTGPEDKKCPHTSRSSHKHFNHLPCSLSDFLSILSGTLCFSSLDVRAYIYIVSEPCCLEPDFQWRTTIPPCVQRWVQQQQLISMIYFGKHYLTAQTEQSHAPITNISLRR